MQSLPDHYRKLEFSFLIRLGFIYNILSKLKKIQRGGGKLYDTKYTDFDGTKYIFSVDIEGIDNGYHISVLNTTKDDCVTVIADSSRKEAIIHNMSYYNNCAKDGTAHPSSGSVLLRFIIRYLRSNKTVLNISRIMLSDHSYILCKDYDKGVKLTRLRMVTRGDTWYMANGFNPYDTQYNEPSIKLLEQLKKNNDFFRDFKTSDVDIIKIAKNIKEVKYDISELSKLIKQYSLFKDFIKLLESNIAKYCHLIENLLEIVFRGNQYNKIVTDFYNLSFYMDI